MSNDDKRRQTIRSRLMDLLADATNEDKYVSRDELKAAGVPERWRSSISRASKRVTSAAAAVDLADEYASEIATNLDEQDAAVADGSIVDRIPRV